MANSKVVLGDEVLIDLTSDTVESAADIAEGKYGHLKDGTRVCGTHRGGSGGAYNVISIDNGDGTQDLRITDAEGAPVYVSKSINSNGTYIPTDDSADAYSSVTVNVPTGAAKSASDVTISGATVTVPAGLYSSQVQKSVASGNAGTPTASKGTVNNHSVTITPSVNNTTGYITGGTKTGTGVTVTASELVSGSETKTENGTYDVTNLSELVVNVSGGGGGSLSFVPDTIIWQHNSYVTIGIDIAADGSLTVYKSSGGGVMNNPKICYPQSDTFNSGNVITSLPTPQSAGTYNLPITVWWDNNSGENNDHNNHTITYTVIGSGSQPVTKTITANGTYNASDDDVDGYQTVVVSVPAVATMNVQAYHGLRSVNTTSLSASGVKLTVAKSGTYKVSWMGARNNNSGTWQTQLYINGSAYGTAQNTFTNTYGQSVTLTGVSLTQGQTVEVYARARGTTYYMMVGNLVIEQTA